MLRVRNLNRLMFSAVDLDVPDGACIAITGASGSGKSVLLRAIADLDPNTGDLRTASCVRDQVGAPAWRRRVALLPAESGWWADDVAAHFHHPQAQRDLLAELGLAPQAMDWQVARLSSGERHRLALLRALEQDPEVLLLDEPTATLDQQSTDAVEALLLARMALGLSVVMVTHDSEQPRRMGAPVLRLEAGRLVAEVGG